MPKFLSAAITLAGLIFAGCAADPHANPENMASAILDALRTEDVDAFRKLSITVGDFDLRANGIDEAKAAQSYVGGNIRPAQQRAQEDRFGWAAAAIDWPRASLHGVSGPTEHGSLAGLSGHPIPYQRYEIELSFDGEVMRGPGLVLVEWDGGLRIVELDWTDRERRRAR